MAKKTLLITGASGKLGKALLAKGFSDRHLLTPPHSELDISDKEAVDKYFEKHSIDEVIHCAAIINNGICEKEPTRAIATNSLGTAYLAEASARKGARFIYISTDYVYPSENGPYKESDEVKPFTFYAWTKLGGELAVKNLKNYCIIRTSFFDPKNIPFDTAFTDAFCSKIPASELAEEIIKLLDKDFIGIINMGQDRISLYDLYKKYKLEIKPEALPVDGAIKRAKDSSLDITLWRQMK